MGTYLSNRHSINMLGVWPVFHLLQCLGRAGILGHMGQAEGFVDTDTLGVGQGEKKVLGP
jgi:hypothetical protein